MINKDDKQVKIEFSDSDIVMKNDLINNCENKGALGFLEYSSVKLNNLDQYLTDGKADVTKYPVSMMFSSVKSVDNVIKQLQELKSKMQDNHPIVLSVFPGMEITDLLIYDSCPQVLVLCVEKKDDKTLSYNYHRINIYGGFIQFIYRYNKNGIIIIPCYDEVRKELKNNQINYKLVYPDKTSKEQKERVIENIRNPYYSLEGENLINNYEESINKLNEDDFAEKIQLKDGEYLEDIISKYI